MHPSVIRRDFCFAPSPWHRTVLACQDPQKAFRDCSKISLITIWLLRDFPIFLEILPEVVASGQSGFVAAAGGNSSADANGDITINPGDRSLGVTVHTGNLALTFHVADQWTILAAVIAHSALPFGVRPTQRRRNQVLSRWNLNTGYRLSFSSSRQPIMSRMNNATYMEHSR
jgi:hypothetical protein